MRLNLRIEEYDLRSIAPNIVDATEKIIGVGMRHVHQSWLQDVRPHSGDLELVFSAIFVAVAQFPKDLRRTILNNRHE